MWIVTVTDTDTGDTRSVTLEEPLVCESPGLLGGSRPTHRLAAAEAADIPDEFWTEARDG